MKTEILRNELTVIMLFGCIVLHILGHEKAVFPFCEYWYNI